ncbi:sigma-54 interaction domain-containing protein [Desulfitobacterium chlororespirans]|uniref:Regulatory protein, Fis family n=1 Tax=Desulfitobacterium chlororespirans DSM 11544 TaxID=1121395 RepID=A0A1M7SJC2_9FIRM|nr:sigma 54-interacting transcriptional regulator [Desulfitobacterium chlororespirans]SHN58539.1 regulatory protein, Fis family [Desulfitobacterium chlororespirans DSM 11544]
MKKQCLERKVRPLLIGKQSAISTEEKNSLTFDNIVGDSHLIRQALEQSQRFASSLANILILGETGTGKELFAEAIHNESRPDGPFLALNCAAIPKSLIESELFGYDNGAFTGANKNGSLGKIELAQGGTLLLDEIGDMPLETQAVLLRVLENKQVMRVGGKEYRPVDFRLIASTHKDLQTAVKNGQFRQDLYYRLNVLKVNIPPLRQRGRDVIILAEYFINTYCDDRFSKTKKLQLSPAARDILLKYDWPGNIRQLENAMIYALNMIDTDVIAPRHLPDEIIDSIAQAGTEVQISGQRTRGSKVIQFGETEQTCSLREAEQTCIIKAMIKSGNNIALAAELLQVSKSTLYRKLEMFKAQE